ncbi:MAG: SUF system NifU family Fe-S cluster assembly protein [Vicinamibacteria bacterium]|nr:SUF system NifU family Fe-S cluster assembly protein [Vicinamibacteria bacterium]
MATENLRELYQEVILDHSKRPRNFGELPGANRQAHGTNPLCGDQATVFLTIEENVVKDARFVGSGCAISTASASMMTEAVKGKTLTEAESLFRRFHALITNSSEPGETGAEELGKLSAFSGVCEFPVRVKCAALAWHTLRAAMQEDRRTVSTEASK